MNATYSDKVKQDAEAYRLLQQATKRLEEVLGPSAASASAAWDLERDEQGRPLYTLTLTDLTRRVAASFTPSEFHSPSHLRFRLLDLWGDLLKSRSDAQMEKVLQLLAQGD